MAKIISSTNCGNSPKMTFLKEFNIAFAKNNLDFIIENVTDEIVWNIIGDRKIEGREDFMDELKKMKSEKTTELFIDQILSHGKTGASNGIIKRQNGKKYAFSNFYVFQNTKSTQLKSITSYVIEI